MYILSDVLQLCENFTKIYPKMSLVFTEKMLDICAKR